MNKNKIFKNLKKLTAVSLTAANLFTFANSGSATIITSEDIRDEQKEILIKVGNITFSKDNIIGQVRKFFILKTEKGKDVAFLKIFNGFSSAKEIKEILRSSVSDISKVVVVYDFDEGFTSDRNLLSLKQSSINFIPLEDANKVLEEKREEKKEEEEATPGANNTQNNQEKPKKGSFVYRHRELISGGLISAGILTMVASAVTIFWNEVKTGCNFVAEKAVELKNKIVKAVK